MRVAISKLIFILLLLGAVRANAQFWEQVNGPDVGAIYGSTIAPNGDIYVLSMYLFRSTDKGASWVALRGGLANGEDADTLKLAFSRNGTMYLRTSTALERSADNGKSWTRISTNQVITDFALGPLDEVYLVTSSSVFVSTNEGDTWVEKFPPFTSGLNRKLFVDSSGNLYLTHMSSILRSTDHGDEWESLQSLQSGDPEDMKVTKHGRLLIADQHRIWASDDGGLSWTEAKLDTDYIIALLMMNGDTVHYVTRNGSLTRSTDNGGTWETIADSLGTGVRWAFEDNEYLYIQSATAVEGDVIRKHAKRDRFLATSLKVHNTNVTHLFFSPTGLYVGSKVDLYSSLYSAIWSHLDGVGWKRELSIDGYQYGDAIVAPSGDIFIYYLFRIERYDAETKEWQVVSLDVDTSYFALTPEFFVRGSGSQILRSSDHGKSWSRETTLQRSITAVASMGSFVYAGANKLFYRSSDQGETWEKSMYFIFIAGSADVRSIACLDSLVVAGVDGSGAYFSYDHGYFWERNSNGIPLLDSIHDILITPNGNIFAATSSGVYEFQNITKKWVCVNDTMIFGEVKALALGKDGRVYAGTAGTGVLRTTKTYGVPSGSVLGSQTGDISIYPNPASTQLHVDLGSSLPGDFTISIYDVLGVRRFVSAKEQTLNISSLPNGQYIVRVTTKETIKTSTFSIMR